MDRKRGFRRREPDERASQGVFALILEEGDYQFLIDTRDLWRPPRVVVRRGHADGEVWLDDDEVSFTRPSRFGPRDEQRVLELVREHIDDLLMTWHTLRDDVRRGRLERNVLVD